MGAKTFITERTVIVAPNNSRRWNENGEKNSKSNKWPSSQRSEFEKSKPEIWTSNDGLISRSNSSWAGEKSFESIWNFDLDQQWPFCAALIWSAAVNFWKSTFSAVHPVYFSICETANLNYRVRNYPFLCQVQIDPLLGWETRQNDRNRPAITENKTENAIKWGPQKKFNEWKSNEICEIG